MSTQNSFIAKAVRYALVSGAFAATATGVAFAAEEQSDEERIEVTGSRIKRTDIEGANPVFSLSREDLEDTGMTSIGDILQDMASAGPALNTTFNNGGDGSTRVDLRGLGPGRTLVLVNGRRWVPGGGGGVNSSVDLNSIPVSIIERIEVLKDGASAVYGSDAMAGVVNIITRKDFEGFELMAHYGESKKGDGQQEMYSLTTGGSFDKGNVMLNVTRLQNRTVMAGDRELSAEPVYGTGVDFGSSTTPQGRFRFPAADVNGVSLGCSMPGLWTLSETGNGMAVPGTNASACGDTDLLPFVFGNHAYNYAPDNYLLTPSERSSVYGQIAYELPFGITFRSEMVYNERYSDQLLAAMPIVLGSDFGVPVTVGATNHYNPFPGHDWVPRRLQRRVVESGGRNFIQDVDTTQLNAALEGTIDIGSGWDWTFNYVNGKNEVNGITHGLFNLTRIAQSMESGCGTVDTSCVAVDWFGGAHTRAMTRPMLDYIGFVAQDAGGDTLKGHQFGISGEIVELPAGPLAVAMGIESWSRDAFDQPDALIATGQSTGNIRQATYGGYDLDEQYVEFVIPVLSDLPFVKALEINIATRSSDYSTYGSNNTNKLGFQWTVMDGLKIRGTKSEGFRAPNIAELFAGQADSYPDLNDPCNIAPSQYGPGADADGDGTVDNTELATFSAANPGCRTDTGAFLPNDYVQANPQIRITVGSNPNLQPEFSDAQTFGVVYEPSFVDGLAFVLDWYKFEIQDAISTVGAQTLLEGCADGSFAHFCGVISRNATGEVMDLVDAGVNVDTMEVTGFDFNVSYKMPETSIGSFKLSVDSSYFDEYLYYPLSGDDAIKLTGQAFGDTSIYPRLKSNISVKWDLNDWSATWQTRFIYHVYEACGLEGYGLCSYDPLTDADPNNDNDIGYNKLDSYMVHDVQASYNFADIKTRATVGIQNVTDEQAQFSTSAFANSMLGSTYDVVGQFFYVRVTTNF